MSTDGSPSPRHDELVAELMGAGRDLSNVIVMFHTAVAAKMGLSATDEKILDVLDRESPLTAGQLADRAGLAPSSITAAIDRLERKGFVLRGPHPQDRRRVTVDLRRERLHEAEVLFVDLVHGLEQLYVGYTEGELAVALRFLRDITAVQRAATARLTDGDD